MSMSVHSSSSAAYKNSTNRAKYVEEIVDEIGFTYYHLHLILMLACANACEAIEILLLCFIQNCVSIEWHIGPFYLSIITSSLFLGQIVGILTICNLADIYGRRKIVLFGFSIVCIFGTLTSFASNIWTLVICRFLVGLGIGAYQTPMYDLTAELLPTKHRGKLGMSSLFIVIGELYIIFVASGTLYNSQWRLTTLYAVLPTVLLTIYGFLCLPESPLWLIQEGNVAEATMFLKRIADEASQDEILLRPIESRIESNSLKFASLLKPTTWLITEPLWYTWFFSNFARYVGILQITAYYSFGDMKCGYKYSEMMFTTLLQVVGVLLALQSLPMGRTLSQVVFLVLASVFSTLPIVLNKGIINMGTILVIGAARACLEGAVTILSIQTPELYRTEHRATGHGAAVAWGRLGGFCAIYWVDCFADIHPFLSSLIFTFVCVMSGLAAIRLPETKHVRLDGSLEYTLNSKDEINDEQIGLIRYNNAAKGRPTIHVGYSSSFDSGSVISDLTG